jgi:hypothetical protein
MFFLTSCAKQTFILNDAYQQVPQPEQTSHFFIYGIAQEQMMDLTKTCPNGVGRIEAYLSPKNVAVQAAIGLLSGGLGSWVYHPRAWKVYCI